MQTKDKPVIYILGNSLVALDATPFYLLPKLRRQFPDIEFIHIDPTEGFPHNGKTSITIIDSVLGIKKVTVFTDLEAFSRSPRITVHDFDLPLELGLMKKLGKLKEVTIIGIPSDQNLQKITAELKKILCMYPRNLHKM